jgi:hypothetical protein
MTSPIADLDCALRLSGLRREFALTRNGAASLGRLLLWDGHCATRPLGDLPAGC